MISPDNRNEQSQNYQKEPKGANEKNDSTQGQSQKQKQQKSR